MKQAFFRLVTFIVLSTFAVACSHDDDVAPTTTATRDENLAMGNPSGATANPANFSNYLLTKAQYTLSYNRDQGKPNWVSWHLSSAWLGSTPRQDNFGTDNTLPTGWYRVSSSSYSGSGFDRGHNCPSADRTNSVEDNSATFLMSNMMPQAPASNQQTWAGLENYCRTLVGAGNELYIICGSYGKGGSGSNGSASTIDDGRVTVPAYCWKVVVVLPVGTDDSRRVTATTRVIAINTPNTNSINSSWENYRTTVDAIEKATGYDLLSEVSTSIQSAVESKVDSGPTN
ncbi:DNA/RNA non-specific endonuclease [Hymenobacter sp. GOD-10R]|uniref:DNA/RNA non-specific endonuclease n=1 Tax=Hymenobacter sp. GOD-10R TaxID=3093922 RepID=UPI002D7894CC|nr:DNA/RNA non-specific endonuclease [Hymenobacter sp. GOD-10R]WRQ27640.1 DNA/RNA non-specific endonuclease [Hymenobacter sp. GOD-10R]